MKVVFISACPDDDLGAWDITIGDGLVELLGTRVLRTMIGPVDFARQIYFTEIGSCIIRICFNFPSSLDQRSVATDQPGSLMGSADEADLALYQKSRQA